jgi:spore maturation protein CgeB
MLDRAFKVSPNFFYGQRKFNDAAKVYFESKICLNNAMVDDINMRCFEALGSGGFLLTDRIPTIEEIFTNKKHLILWDNLDDMAEKIKYYLDKEDERKQISEQGYEYVMANHTFENRVMTILSAIKDKSKLKPVEVK